MDCFAALAMPWLGRGELDTRRSRNIMRAATRRGLLLIERNILMILFRHRVPVTRGHRATRQWTLPLARFRRSARLAPARRGPAGIREPRPTPPTSCATFF